MMSKACSTMRTCGETTAFDTCNNHNNYKTLLGVPWFRNLLFSASAPLDTVSICNHDLLLVLAMNAGDNAGKHGWYAFRGADAS